MAKSGSSEAVTTNNYNKERRANRLRTEVRKGHNWRVQVWAQQKQRIDAKNAELEAMGFEPEVLFEPDFANDEMVEHYTKMSLDG